MADDEGSFPPPSLSEAELPPLKGTGARTAGSQRSAKIAPISPSKEGLLSFALPPSPTSPLAAAQAASSAVQATLASSASFVAGNSQKATSVATEVMKRAGNMTLVERDTDAASTLVDRFIYSLENYLASAPGGSLNILLIITAFAMVGMSVAWAVVMNLGAVDEGHEPLAKHPFHNIHLYIFYTFQIFASGGYDKEIGFDSKYPENHLSSTLFVILARVIYIISLIIGLVIFAVLVGIITAGFEAILTGIEEGKSKVMEKDHTLILGWNEGTIRVVIQIAHLRQMWQNNNKSLLRRWLPWLRVKASSPVASNPVVIMLNPKHPETGEERSKPEIDALLRDALAARGISPSSTRVGCHIIVRMGDPTLVHDLVRVNAPAATSILVMMTSEDEREHKNSNGKVVNGATIRTLLALRSVMCSQVEVVETFDERDVRIVTQLMEYSPFIEAACFRSATGRRLVEPLELSLFVNNLMFSCGAKALLSHLYMKILNFETTAMRCKVATEIPGGPDGKMGFLVGKTVQEASYQHLWKHCIIIGITNEDVLLRNDESMMSRGGEIMGLCAQPDYVIQEDDLIMFIGATSTPEAMLEDDLEAPPDELENNGIDLCPLDRKQLELDMLRPMKILIIGWRWVWTTNPTRLKNRIYEIARSAAAGSYIVFLNQMPTDNPEGSTAFNPTSRAADRQYSSSHIFNDSGEPPCFRTTINATGAVTEISPGDGGDGGSAMLPGCSGGWRLDEFPNMRVFHAGRRNAASYGDLVPVMETRFDSAIVLGTQATKEQLDPQSTDTRVLSMLLCIKHVTVDSDDRPEVWRNTNEPPLHIVSENEIDQTAEVAVVPSGSGKDPDFINTQAITARALVLALAYPAMQPAIRELFDDQNDSDGNPIFDIIPSYIFGLGGKGDFSGGSKRGSSSSSSSSNSGGGGMILHFSSVQRLVSVKFRGWAAAIGYLEHDKLHLAPGQNCLIDWADVYVVTIRRNFKMHITPPC